MFELQVLFLSVRWFQAEADANNPLKMLEEKKFLHVGLSSGREEKRIKL
jgi:hypothetical protein